MPFPSLFGEEHKARIIDCDPFFWGILEQNILPFFIPAFADLHNSLQLFLAPVCYPFLMCFLPPSWPECWRNTVLGRCARCDIGNTSRVRKHNVNITQTHVNARKKPQRTAATAESHLAV